VPHADADDYFWIPSSPPYVQKRPEHERVALMRGVFVARESWVLSGSMVGWGARIVAECDAIVFLTLDPEERLRRLELREIRRRAGTIFDEAAWVEFMRWARGYDDPDFEGRSRSGHEAWLRQVDRPVLRLESRLPSSQLLDAVLTWEPR
jgi:hypothetical protein